MSIEDTSAKKIPNNTRSLIIKKYENGKSISEISKELEINRNTITSIIRLFQNTGRVEVRVKRVPRRKKLSEEAKNFIRTEVDNDVSLTLKVIKQKLSESLNISCSVTTVENALKELHYSFKRVELVPVARNSENNVNSREIYCERFLRLDESNVVFIDEFGVSCSTRQKYGRSLVGTSPRKQVRAIRSKNFSVCAAICKKKILFYDVKESAYNREGFIQFLNNLFSVFGEEEMGPMTIIMDNCSIHKGDAVEEVIRNQGHTLMFLPAYSPQLNPIEEAFSKWKCLIKNSNSNSREELLNAIMISMANITEDDCIGFFNHVRCFAVRGLRREDF